MGSIDDAEDLEGYSFFPMSQSYCINRLGHWPCPGLQGLVTVYICKFLSLTDIASSNRDIHFYYFSQGRS